MPNFKEIDNAREVLGLGEEASIEEIKESYWRLSLKYHPDKCKEKAKKKCEEMFKKVNSARDILMRYCAGYKYSFREEDVWKSRPEGKYDELLKRFYDGWMTNL